MPVISVLIMIDFFVSSKSCNSLGESSSMDIDAMSCFSYSLALPLAPPSLQACNRELLNEKA